MPGRVVHTMEVFFVVEKVRFSPFSLCSSFDILCQIDNGNLEPHSLLLFESKVSTVENRNWATLECLAQVALW
jgi:hypothetical protein